MEDLDNRLKRRNPFVAAQIISKLVETIKTKQHSLKSSDNSELKYLVKQCACAEDPSVSLTASMGLVTLVECSAVDAALVLNDLMSSFAASKTNMGVVRAICEILQLKLTKTYDLDARQHPLVAVLRLRPDSWRCLLDQIRKVYRRNNRSTNELLRPLLLYTLCGYDSKVPEIFKSEVFKLVLDHEREQSLKIISPLLIWLQVKSCGDWICETSEMLVALSKKTQNEFLALWLAGCLCELLANQRDPEQVLESLSNTIESLEANGSLHLGSPMLVLLAKCLQRCCVMYLYDILLVVKRLFLLNCSTRFASNLIVASTIPWIARTCLLSQKSKDICNEILTIAQTAKSGSSTKELLTNNSLVLALKSSNFYVEWALRMCCTAERINSENVTAWLERVETLPREQLATLTDCLVGLFFQHLPVDAIARILRLILKICESDHDTSIRFGYHLFVRLAKEREPELQVALLKSLPKLAAASSDNLPNVILILESMRAQVNLRPVLTTIYYELWKSNEQCYGYLQNLLLEMPESWEFCIVKAHVFKEISLAQPEKHGTELVRFLSDVMNRCIGEEGALATSLAIDGITWLCRKGIIDIVSTLDMITPKFGSDYRPRVAQSFCRLLSEVAVFANDPEFSEQPIDKAVAHLWNILLTHKDAATIKQACDGLALFPLDSTCAGLPEPYKPTPKAGIYMMSGSVWLTLLTQKPAVEEFLVKVVSREVSGYRKATYTTQRNSEPENFAYLPEHSTVRALGNYMRRQVLTWDLDKQTYLACLRIFSQEYSKPLPPLNWCFLQELIHNPEMRRSCICIASKQVQMSGTARRLIENYIMAQNEVLSSAEIALEIYENLAHLANSVQPVILGPFIEKTLEAYKNEALEKVVDHLVAVLTNDKVQPSNKLVVSERLINLARRIGADNAIFEILLKSLVVLPQRYLDEVVSVKDVDKSDLKIGLRVKCAIAIQDKMDPLTWINDFIEATNSITSLHEYTISCISSVLRHHRDSQAASAWILELMRQIQSVVVTDVPELFADTYSLSILVIAMVILSGRDVLVETLCEKTCLDLLPQSVASLIESYTHWNDCLPQMLEWFLFMVNSKYASEDFEAAFYLTIAALRHEDAFRQSGKWTKYIGCSIPSRFIVEFK